MAGSWRDFKKDSLKFCQERFKRALDHQSQFREINLENMGMYEGRDPVLETRAEQKDVLRSSLFMQILAPAVDTNVADALAIANGMRSPITVRPSYGEEDLADYYEKNPQAPPMEYQALRDRALWVERQINNQLRQCGYIPFGFQEHVLGAEVYRTPSVVKVGWRKSHRKIAEIRQQQNPLLQLMSKIMPGGGVNWREDDGGEFFAEFIPPDEFLYDPMVSVHEFDRSCFSAHVVWRSEDELLSQAAQMGYDHNLIRKFFDKSRSTRSDTGTGYTDTQVTDHRMEALEDRGEGGYWQRLDPSGRAMVVECYIYLVDGDGNERPQFVTILGADKIINRDGNYNMPYEGLCHPFVPLVGNPMPGTMEGLSSVDLGRGHQRAYNDTINFQFDALSYGLFGPMKMSVTNSFIEKPVHRLGAIWRLRNAEDLQPVIEPRTPPEMTYLLTHTDDNLQRSLNTSYTRQGVSGNPYEKATQTNLKSTGAQRRSVPKNARFGKALSDVAMACIVMNQQFSDNRDKYIIPGGFIVDAPGFTNGYDKEMEKQDMLLLLSTVSQLPLYQSGTGQDKIRQIVSDLAKTVAPSNADAYTITKDEMVSDIQRQSDAQAAQAALQQSQSALTGKESKSV